MPRECASASVLPSSRREQNKTLRSSPARTFRAIFARADVCAVCRCLVLHQGASPPLLRLPFAAPRAPPQPATAFPHPISRSIETPRPLSPSLFLLLPLNGFFLGLRPARDARSTRLTLSLSFTGSACLCRSTRVCVPRAPSVLCSATDAVPFPLPPTPLRSLCLKRIQLPSLSRCLSTR